jgi:hypothetical protein
MIVLITVTPLPTIQMYLISTPAILVALIAAATVLPVENTGVSTVFA